MTKKRIIKKKVVSKKIAVKKKVANSSMALATISYNDIAKPEMYENKKNGREMHLLQSTFPQKLIEFINQPTPRKYVQTREGTGGKKFDYIPGWYAKKCANYAFGFNHSFEIKKREIVGLSAIVEGRLIVNDPKTGRQIFFKDDIGSHPIRFLKDKARVPENAVDLGNDYKGAATDALKRCMVQIGFWKDVYGMNEAKGDNIYIKDTPVVEVVVDETDSIAGPDGEPVFTCQKCAGIVEHQVANYSKKIYGKILCREHQAGAKRK